MKINVILIAITLIILLFSNVGYHMIFVLILLFNTILLLEFVYVCFAEKISYFFLYYLFFFSLFFDLVYLNRLGYLSLILLTPLACFFLFRHYFREYIVYFVFLFLTILFNFLLIFYFYDSLNVFKLFLKIDFFSIVIVLYVIGFSFLIYWLYKKNLSPNSIKIDI